MEIFKDELAALINKYGIDADANTPEISTGGLLFLPLWGIVGNYGEFLGISPYLKITVSTEIA